MGCTIVIEETPRNFFWVPAKGMNTFRRPGAQDATGSTHSHGLHTLPRSGERRPRIRHLAGWLPRNRRLQCLIIVPLHAASSLADGTECPFPTG